MPSALKEKPTEIKQTVQATAVSKGHELFGTSPADPEDPDTTPGQSGWVVLMQQTKDWWIRLRLQLIPLHTAAVVAAGTEAVTRQTTLRNTFLGVLVFTITLTAGGVFAARRVRRRNTSRANVTLWRCNITIAWTVALVWHVFAVASGASIGLNQLVTLLVATGALATPWWFANSTPDPDTAAEADLATSVTRVETNEDLEVEEEQATLDERAETWNHLVRTGTIMELRDITNGWQVDLELPLGSSYQNLNYEQVKNTVLGAYRLPAGRMYPQAIPDAPVNHARVSIMTRDPLRHVIPWTGPTLDPETGAFPLMSTMDGQWETFKFWNPGTGASHALVAGTTRSGKSSTLNAILSEALCSDRLIPMTIDVGGVSLSYWQDKAAISAESHVDALALVQYLLQVLKTRARILRELRGSTGGSLTPEPEMPGIVLVIDEAHNVLKDNSTLLRPIERLSQEGAKYGLSLVLATQSPHESQLGHSTVLRDMLKAGTVVAHRSTEQGTDNKISVGDNPPEQLKDLPATFPDGSTTNGMGYMFTSTRKIRARSTFVDLTREEVETTIRDHATFTKLDEASSRVSMPTMKGPDADENEDDPEPSVGEDARPDAEAQQDMKREKHIRAARDQFGDSPLEIQHHLAQEGVEVEFEEVLKIVMQV